MAKRYPPDLVANAKKLIIYEGWSPRKVSEFYDGSPHWQTIRNWAEELNEEGKDWFDLRQDYIDSVVNQITPHQIERLYQKRIYEVLSDPEFGVKHSDSLRKLQKDFHQITEPGRQIPVVYAMLTEFINYMRQHHSELLTADLLAAIRDYKNYQRNKLQS